MDTLNVQKDEKREVTVEIRNKVEISGVIDSDVELDHITHGEEMYSFTLRVPRLNKNVNDFIKVEVPEKAIDVKSFHKGDIVRIEGQFRSFNRRLNPNSQKVSLILSVFVEDMEKIQNIENLNTVKLRGHVCKEPSYRKTPTGRGICDVMIVVGRNYNRSDYIPCITWGRDAKYSKNLKVGADVYIEGRLQSRNYQKRLPNGEFESRVAYEVSVSRVAELTADVKVVETYTYC